MPYVEIALTVLAAIIVCIHVVAWRIDPRPPSATISETNKPRVED